LFVVLGIGAVVGLAHAPFIIYFRVPSLVVTLGFDLVDRARIVPVDDRPLPPIGGIDRALIDAVVRARFLGLPLAFDDAIAAAFVLWYVFDYTPLGGRLLFVGRGREVARLDGIAVNRVRWSRRLSPPPCSRRQQARSHAGVLGSA